MIIDFDNSIESYRTFLKVKDLPTYRIVGHSAEFPDEYSERMGFGERKIKQIECSLSDQLFDYQGDIAKLAIKKKKFAVFADCGLGKTLIMLEFARHCRAVYPDDKILIVSPLMVVNQTSAECEKFYGESLKYLPASRLNQWLSSEGSGIGITNYEALRDDAKQGNLKALLLDESSMLKSAYGKYGTKCIELGKGLDYKLALSGTPAPNDRIEFANHAVFLDIHKTVNEFLAVYFVNKAQTSERWIIKPHALIPFYRNMSQWCIFLTDPAVYGWEDNSETIPPIHVHIDRVPMTEEQQSLVQKASGAFLATKPGGIAERSKLSQIAKGKGGISTNKPKFIRDLVDSWPEESTIIWCHYNDEQDTIDKVFPEAESIRGKTPFDQRLAAIERFKKGETKVLISKPKILGFGLNLQVATRQIFSGLMDCYDDQTEVLTIGQEWKSFGDLTCKDKVGTWNSRLTEIEWQNPTKVFYDHYSGPMVHFYEKGNFDLLVTPNHRMFVNKVVINKHDWQYVLAEQIVESFERGKLEMVTFPNLFYEPLRKVRSYSTAMLCQEPKKVHYDGMIGCATVPNSNLIVRRNGYVCVSGNSYEMYYQAVKRSNRVGSTRPLNVHIPITDVEEPMIRTVLEKAHRVQSDAEIQEKMFKKHGFDF